MSSTTVRYLQARCVQDAVNAWTLRPDYEVTLPILPASAFNPIEDCRITRDASQTIGDGLIYEFVTELLLGLSFGQDQRVFAMLRQILTSNETFRYIFANVGLVDDPTVDDKVPGDVLEIYLDMLERASKDTEHRELVEWIETVWGPLALAGHAALLEFKQKTGTKRPTTHDHEDAATLLPSKKARHGKQNRRSNADGA